MASKGTRSASAARRKQDFLNAQKASMQKNDEQRSSGKKQLPDPTHIGHFLMMLVMKVCRTILFVDTSVKIGVYLIGVMVGSMICDLFAVPKTFLANSRNPLNQYFVKIGWGWTFTFIGAYILLTSLVYCCRDVPRMCQHIMRLVVGTILWYTCTSIFVHVENAVGTCTVSAHDDKTSCLQAGKAWLGFDISGHVFLEIHCLLIISEEVKTFKEWKRLGDILQDENLPDKRKVEEQEILQAQINYKTLTPYIKIVLIWLTIMMVLFEVMLLVTTIYRFHMLSHKVTASFIAVICWFLSYRVIYRTGSPFPFMPVPPGHSPLNFMKIT